MNVRFDDDSMGVDLSDGRTLGVPPAWFPRLLRATPEQRDQLRISARGLHWEALDEDISIAALLAGQPEHYVPAEAGCPTFPCCSFHKECEIPKPRVVKPFTLLR